MERFFDNYDLKKLKEAEKLLEEVAEYNNIEYHPTRKKLMTILNKLRKLLEDEMVKRRL